MNFLNLIFEKLCYLFISQFYLRAYFNKGDVNCQEIYALKMEKCMQVIEAIPSVILPVADGKVLSRERALGV